MALLQCCFESADYVELIQLEDEPKDQDGVSRTLSKIQEQGPKRPPRRLPEILCAMTVTLLGMMAGAAISQQLWLLLRLRTGEWCQDAPNVFTLGLDAAHLGKSSHAFYCQHLRNEPSVESGITIFGAVIWGPLTLYLTFGASYFAYWTEEEELRELERLYRERGRGESLVLSSWRIRRVAFFVFDILVAMWLRYYLDLYLDVQAMKIFWLHGDKWFFLSNFSGIVLGLLWTAVEFYKILRDDGKDAADNGLPGWQVLVVGLLIPLAGLHVTYLSILSLIMGVKHRFLFISTLAESVLESAVSAFVQTYAVVFSKLTLADKVDLYSSIALSFVSIGYAFSALDKYDGGELMVKVPGLCRGSSAKWWGVFIFRIAEVTSRATSLALFQCVWRPWGIATVMFADTVLVVTMAAIFQCARGQTYGRGGGLLIRDNLVYALPSSICLMTPMLEKDSPMTLPPEIYYSVRVLELGGMAALMGWKLDWDIDAARELYTDDALIIASFVLSTAVMLLMCIVLRQFIAVRTLLEAPADMWHMRPFTVTQQVLRNRILGVETGSKSRAWQSEQRRIMAKIQRAPHRASRLIQSDLADDMPKEMTQAEWDARFLGAKVSYHLEQALRSLATTFADRQVDKVQTKHSNKSATSLSRRNDNALANASPVDNANPSAAPGNRLASRQGNSLRTGCLIHLRCTGGGLTASDDGPVVMRWAGDTSDQKFVVEAADAAEGFGLLSSSALGEPIMSGGFVRLRALRDGAILRLTAKNQEAKALPDEERAQPLDSWGLEAKIEARVGVIEPESLFSLMLWREQEYRSARRFALSVKPLNKGCLEVRSFMMSGDSGDGSADFVDSGWRIASINGQVATPEMVEEILAQARQDMEDETLSEDTKETPRLTRGSTANPSVMEPARSASVARSGSVVSAKSHTKGEKIRVCFEKAYGTDMAIGIGDRVVLRVAAVPAVGAAADAAVGYSLEIGHGPSGLEAGSGTRVLSVSTEGDPLPLTVEPAEIGSRDDPPLYSWAAEEIRRRAEADLLRASLAEKCRVAIVVGYNSRANRLRGTGMLACTRDLHLRMLRLFTSLVRGYREIEVDFDGCDEVLEELRFCTGRGNNAQPLVVEAVDAEDGAAAAAGVQPGDEIVEVEVDRNGNRDSLLRSTKEIREVLGQARQITSGDAGAKPRGLQPPSAVVLGSSPRTTPAVSPPLSLLFRSPIRTPVDSGVQKVLVAEAGLVAQLLPSWEEIARPEDHGGEAPSCRAAAAARLLRHDEFFRLKCSLVTSLLQQGWELKYAGFADSAMRIHTYMDALTRDALRARFPGTDDATKQVREGLLSEQLDMLTASWAAVPRAVKEQQPEQLRKLFRYDVELVAMHDAVDAAYKAWTDRTRDNTAIVEMPGALQRFVERVRPPYAIEALSSAWILRAWFGPEFQREYEAVQRIINHFTEIYENAEQYWIRKLEGAASHMERTQEQLERALEAADMRVALIPSANAGEELKRIQTLLAPDKLVLKEDLHLGAGEDKQLIPAGLKLVRRGQVFERFKSLVENAELHRRLTELAPADGSDLRLLFGGDDYNQARTEAAEAIGELGAIIRVVKNAAAAFPDVALQCQELLDKHHKGELRAVTQENKRRIQIQEKEAEEMVRTANIRLMLAENQKKAAEEKLREAEEERVMAELAKVDVQKRADQWWDNLQVMGKEKEALESEKTQLESEKMQWTQVQSLMELEKSELQADIEKAKEERRKLEQAAEKWQGTLQRVKAQAEEKEAHLKEIQAILQKQQEEAAKQPESGPASSAEEPMNFTVTQLMSVLSKAFQGDAVPAAAPASETAASTFGLLRGYSQLPTTGV
eukprot:TRINITY_DN5689_c0_g1_i1.p1 TRINITY_DN5689_c0_g1~~TRINITY_DN5689_c0_g1_i1.p1  ORF type:complete len:1859 (+),score=473.63 TRINITY_DN5689_c0_g1_i1:70-5577(+)